MEDRKAVSVRKSTYLEKRSMYPPFIHEKAKSNTEIIVVVPCYREDKILDALNSLNNCRKTLGHVEIIVVINSSEADSEETILINKKTEKTVKTWIEATTSINRSFFVFNVEGIKTKVAGVGYARKIGMDEATYRFLNVNKQNGIIVNFDADCGCSSNYLVEIESHFRLNPKTNACSIYYEHPLCGSEFSNEIYRGIIHYELFLRYHYQGLKFTGHPHIHQTVGSCMAVRCDIYQQQGGMNKRKAGEDFYFINKISQLGNYSNLNTTTVYPSPRLSNRVPFGTGKAVQNWLDNGEIIPYDLRDYLLIRELFSKVTDFYTMDKKEIDSFLISFPSSFNIYLRNIDILKEIGVIKNNVSNQTNFENRFFKWFNPFILMKFLNYLREENKNKLKLIDVAIKLLQLINIPNSSKLEKNVLVVYRGLEKSATTY